MIYRININGETRDATPEEAAEIEANALALSRGRYVMQRQMEYPPMVDYLDGMVKGDQAQIDAYIAACLAVKAKYPKPA